MIEQEFLAAVTSSEKPKPPSEQLKRKNPLLSSSQVCSDDRPKDNALPSGSAVTLTKERGSSSVNIEYHPERGEASLKSYPVKPPRRKTSRVTAIDIDIVPTKESVEITPETVELKSLCCDSVSFSFYLGTLAIKLHYMIETSKTCILVSAVERVTSFYLL